MNHLNILFFTCTLSNHLSFLSELSGAESMGLFWSMKSKPGRANRRLFKSDVMSPYKVSIKVLRGFFNFEDLPWQENEEYCLASHQLLRSYSKPGIKRVSIEEDGLYGTLFLPPGSNIQSHLGMISDFLISKTVREGNSKSINFLGLS